MFLIKKCYLCTRPAARQSQHHHQSLCVREQRIPPRDNSAISPQIYDAKEKKKKELLPCSKNRVQCRPHARTRRLLIDTRRYNPRPHLEDRTHRGAHHSIASPWDKRVPQTPRMMAPSWAYKCRAHRTRARSSPAREDRRGTLSRTGI